MGRKSRNQRQIQSDDFFVVTLNLGQNYLGIREELKDRNSGKRQ